MTGEASAWMLALVDAAGCIALLLWSTHMIRKGAKRAFKGRLGDHLAARLRGRFSAFGTGLAAAVLLQSSTAVGLIGSGLAAAGIVELGAGLALMLGANVGSALIIPFLTLDADALAPALLLGGYLLSKRRRRTWRKWSSPVIALALLIMALKRLLTLVEPLAASGAAKALIDGPAPDASLPALLLPAMFGAGFACLAHSGVAAVLIAMSLGQSGGLSLPAALALAIGANVGSAVNPVLAYRGRRKAALRLPIGSLILRSLGACLLLAALPWMPIPSSGEGGVARMIALSHVGFNLGIAVVCLPFTRHLARMLERMLPDDRTSRSGAAPVVRGSAIAGTRGRWRLPARLLRRAPSRPAAVTLR